MTYTTLKADIADNAHRTDLTAVIPGFIQRAEAFMFRELNIRDLEISVTGTSTGKLITVPADFAYLVKVTTAIHDGRERLLNYVSDYTLSAPPATLNAGYLVQLFYAAFNTSASAIPIAGTGFAYKLYYGVKVKNLTASVATNWLLDNAYDLYLQASLLEAHRYTQDAEQIVATTQIVGGMVDSVRRLIERKAQPGRGSLQIKPRRLLCR